MQPDRPTLDRLEALGAPPKVAEALVRLRDGLREEAGANLEALVLYGGLARGRYRPGHSDVNLLILLRDTSVPSLAAVAPLLREARRSIGVDPLVLTRGEIPSAAAVFPTKFLDIRDHHAVLWGEDPLDGLVVPRELVRLRIEQELTNHELRLRRRYLAETRQAERARTLAGVVRPLAVELAALLAWSGRAAPESDRTAAVLDAAAEAFDLDRAALAEIARLRSDLDGAVASDELYDRVLRAIARAIRVARAGARGG